MTDASHNPANFCYRHPDRQSYILCQRCGRTVCTDCQTQAAVGVHCPECVREGRASMNEVRRTPTVLRAAKRIFAPQSTVPVVTYSIIALCVLVYLTQILPGSPVTNTLLFYGPYMYSEPWRALTALFVHSQGSPLHLLFNMFSLFIFGPIIERMLGRGRFLALYLISGVAGSIAVLLIAPLTPVVGASGAIFGLLGAFVVIQRGLGGNNVQLYVLIGLNLVIGFLPGTNIAWEAHVGGLVAGVVLAFIFMRTRRREQRVIQALLVVAVVVVLVVLALLRLYVL